MNEHTGRETQDILHLEKLCKTVVLIDWEKLPVERNPQVEESRSRYNYSYYDDLGGDFWEYNYKKTRKVENKKIWFIDEKYNNHVSFMELDSTGKIIEIDFDKE
jgi:hypothetical protein